MTKKEIEQKLLTILTIAEIQEQEGKRKMSKEERFLLKKLREKI